MSLETRRRFTVEGLMLEKLLRQAGEKDVRITAAKREGAKRLTGELPEKDAPTLQALCEKGGWRLTLGGVTGWGRLRARLRKRWLLAVLCALALLCVVTALQLVWTVEVLDAGTYAGDVRSYLTETGVTPFRWKRDIDTARLRDELTWRYPKVAWVEVGWRGTALHIRFLQGVPTGETAAWQGSGDVVAARAGVVDRVVALAGTPVCKVGDVVAAGDVLIRGEERGAGETTHPVRARGQVTARVWDGAVVRQPLSRWETDYTGRTAERTVVACPLFSLWQAEASGFEKEDVSLRRIPLGGVFFPLWVQKETCLECRVSLRPRDLRTAQAECGLAALHLLAQRVGGDDVFVDKWVDYCMIEGEILEASAVGERLIDIGRCQAAALPPEE